MNVLDLTASSIAAGVADGSFSAEEILRLHLDRIASWEPRVSAFISVLEDRAAAMARAVDEKRRRGGRLGRLAGVPVAVKDNIQIAGEPTTCASRILEGHIAAYDATVIERLSAEDAVFIGKTNMDEFAMGSSTENSSRRPTRNPWDTGRVPGGSSGGSAAAVSSGMCALALGSDTGGSIRQPASFCGVAGLKPGYGRVSRCGLVAFASSLDQIGPLARTSADAALALSVLAGPDPRDATSAAALVPDFVKGLEGGAAGLTIGLPKEYFISGTDPEVERAVAGAVKVLEGLGGRVREVSLPHTRHALSAYYIIAPCEASSNLARFDGIRYGRRSPRAGTLEEVYELSRGEGFGAEVKRRIMLGTYALSSGYYDAYYGKAQKARALIRRDFDEVFKGVDILAAPVAPTAAFRIGEKASDPLSMYLSDVFTIPASLAGIPGISIPCGLSREGLPIGLQLLAGPLREDALLRAAAAFEGARPFPRVKEAACA